MADKAITELVAAEDITATDLFVLQQNDTAKKLPGQVLLNWLTRAADGHGGIKSIEKLKTNVLADTYRITLADTTTFDFVVNNGRGINSITKTGTSGLVDTYKISFNDGTTSTFTVTNGEKGDKGDRADIWVKYASQKPTASSHSFGDVPDAWIGIATGHNIDKAPTDWQQYTWFQWKGEKGDTGAAARLVSSAVEYQVSDFGNTPPSGVWVTSIPTVAQGKYLWTRITNIFNSGSPVVAYVVTRMGMDGAGSVASVAGVSPSSNGNVPLKAADIGAAPSNVYRCGTFTGDLNDAITPGWYWVKAVECTNTPFDGDNLTGKYGHLEVITPGYPDSVANVFHRFTQYSTGYTWVRTSVNGWNDWIRVDSVNAYHVGSIYMSASNTSPASLFGGTWEQLKDRFLLGAGSAYAAGATGGAATHTLTVDQIPSHNHTISASTADTGGFGLTQAASYADRVMIKDGGTITTSASGGGKSHNNMPPYLVVYMWKRVA